MKLPVAKIELAAAKDGSRYTINSVQFDAQKKRMIATDGHILASVPVETETNDHTCLIPLAAIAKIRKMGSKIMAANVECNGKITARDLDSSAVFEYGEGPFPNWEAVVPAEAPATICINFQLLNRLAQALGANPDRPTITLHVKDASSAVRVTCEANPDAIGVIMPCRL